MTVKKKLFWEEELKKISWLNWVIKMIPIPVDIINSILISSLVLEAVAGNVQEVLGKGMKLLGLLFFSRIITFIIDVIYRRKCSVALHRCKMKLYQCILGSPLMIQFMAHNGEMKENLNDDFTNITNRELKIYPELGAAVMMAILYLIFLIMQSPVIACVIGLISILQIIPPIIVKRFMQVNYEETREIEAQITDFIIEGIDGFATIKLYQLKDWWIGKMDQLNQTYRKIGNRSIYTSEVEIAMNSFVTSFLQYGTYGIIGVLILYSYTTLEAGIQAIALSGSFFGAVKTIFSAIPNLAVSKVAEKRILELYKADTEQGSVVESGDIQAEGLSVVSENQSIVDNCSFCWKENQTVLVKGENGAGKSTLLKAILGMMPHSEGMATVGGVETEKLSLDNFPDRICYLPQQDLLLSVTAQELYEMISAEKSEEMMQCAMLLGVSGETLGTTGIHKLSGGERKKVYLALGFCIKSKILIMDEPTNSLDDASKQILGNMLKKYEGSVIVITHESLFDDIADCIYRIEGRKLQGGI